MAEPIIVVGHKNPDNDSISSAVAYAYFKNALASRDAALEGTHADVEYVPACLGPLPAESAWVLAENELDEPKLISHVYTRVCDVMTPGPISVPLATTVMEAGRLLRTHNVRSLVVNNPDGTFAGLFTRRTLAERYVEATYLFDEGGRDAVSANLQAMLDEQVSTLLTTDVVKVSPEQPLRDVEVDIERTPLRKAVVVDEGGAAVGVITRTDLGKKAPRKVVLVDHNEVRQAVDGIQSAEVVEIIDHHRIADVTTANPIQFLNRPLGSTATIISLEFENHDLDMPKPIATILLSAILTDTVILKSPTATDIDRVQVEKLAKKVGVDPTEFGVTLFRKRAGKEKIPVEKLVGADAKEFQMGDATVLIAQYETVDLPSVLEREEEIRAHMRDLVESHGYEFALLMATDIVAEGSQFICEGNRSIVSRVFDIDCTGVGGTWMPGVLSRKKQVAAKILA